MSAQEIITSISRLGITLSLNGDRLRVDAPKGVVTNELIRQITDHKSELLAIICGEGDIDLLTEANNVVAPVPHPTDDNLVKRLKEWAMDDPVRWKRIHSTLLKTYPLTWVFQQHRRALVSWAAAELALTRAMVELERFGCLDRLLNQRERNARAGRQVDIQFWGRLSTRLLPQAEVAMTQDPHAVAALIRLIKRQ